MKSNQLLLLIGISALLVSCSKKEKEEDLASLNITPPMSSESVEEKKEELPKYAYPHTGKRDPFYPLAGGAGGGGLAGAIVTAQDLINLQLKGIFKDRKGKVAVIASSDGDAYVIKGGKIYDKKNRVISGVSGVIKDNSVVIISQNKILKELPLRKITQ